MYCICRHTFMQQHVQIHICSCCTPYSRWLTLVWLCCLPTDAYPKTEMIYTWTKGPQHSVEVPPESSSLVQYDLIGQTVSSETIKSITGETCSSFQHLELSAEFYWLLKQNGCRNNVKDLIVRLCALCILRNRRISVFVHCIMQNIVYMPSLQ